MGARVGGRLNLGGPLLIASVGNTTGRPVRVLVLSPLWLRCPFPLPGPARSLPSTYEYAIAETRCPPILQPPRHLLFLLVVRTVIPPPPLYVAPCPVLSCPALSLRPRPSLGVPGALCRVSRVSRVAEPSVPVRVLSVTCAAADACSPPPRSGAAGERFSRVAFFCHSVGDGAMIPGTRWLRWCCCCNAAV